LQGFRLFRFSCTQRLSPASFKHEASPADTCFSTPDKPSALTPGRIELTVGYRWLCALESIAGEEVGIKVFVVDDLDNMRALLADVFETITFEIVGTAGSEAEAKLWLEDHPCQWDLTVVDLMLSQGTGFGVITRAREIHPSGCIAVLSSFVSETIEKHCLKLGADAAFDKANSTEFLSWVRRVAEAANGFGPSEHAPTGAIPGDPDPPPV
jgi:two-component system, OmpR family, response regulator